MEYSELIQLSIDYIEEHLRQQLTPEELAGMCGFSVIHFYRVFGYYVGMPVMEYVKRRKLTDAMNEIAGGKRIIDVAMDYGFETHTGFSKAFRKQYGVTPNTCRLRMPEGTQSRIDLMNPQKRRYGGIDLIPQIIERPEIKLAGFKFRVPTQKAIQPRLVPAFWNECGVAGAGYEGRMYDTLYPPKHGEYCLCVDVDTVKDEYVFVMGVAVENYDKVTTEMCTLELPAATYAVFTTLPAETDALFIEAIHGAWHYIIKEWLPASGHAWDQDKSDFEFYDERCHPGEELVMEIWLPIKQTN